MLGVLECHLTYGRPCYREHGLSRQRRLREGLAADQRLEGLEAARNVEPQYQDLRVACGFSDRTMAGHFVVQYSHH
jgi:hypothetical protein